MITPSTTVRFQYSRHHAMSYCSGSFSVILVCPQRATRRYQGLFEDATCPGESGGGLRFDVADESRGGLRLDVADESRGDFAWMSPAERPTRLDPRRL